MIKSYIYSLKKQHTAYYISSDGNTNNTGLSPLDPKVFEDIPNLDFSIIKNIKLKSGDVFEGQLTITDDITIDSYFHGEKPKVLGSTAITGFVSEGGGLYSKVMDEPEWLFSNGNIMKLSQTPWIPTTSTPSGNTITINHSDVAGYSDIVGSKLMYYKREYSFEDIMTVIAYDGAGTITLDNNVTLPIDIGNDIILMGKADYFENSGEWAYEGGTLYIYSSNTPSNIRYSNYNYIININAPSVTINNIELSESFHSIIRVDPDAENCSLSINNCDINNVRTYGILNLGDNSDITLYNNEISFCGFCGFNSNVECSLDITYNSIHHIACLENPGTEDRVETANVSRWGSSGVFARRVNNGIFAYNKIHNIGYCGIAIEGGYNKIYNNIIHDYLITLADGGGIYVLGYNSNCTSCFPALGNKIYNNIVYNAYGANIIPARAINGIYLDQGCTDTEVYRNVVYNIGINSSTSYGSFFTNTMVANSYIHDNIFVGINKGGKAMIYLRSGGTTVNPINNGNIFENNVYALKKSDTDSYCYRFDLFTTNNPFGNSGYSDNNYFFNPYGTIIARRDSTEMTFSQLQTQYGQEVNSVEKSNWLTYVNEDIANDDVKLYTNETDTDTTIIAPSGYEDIDGNDVSSQELTVPAYYGLLILKS